MAHLRERFAKNHIKDALRFSPLVGVLGQRQVGKTTLVEGMANNSYVTMDDEGILSSAELAPQNFIEQFQKLTVIDECQKSPNLFPALKLRVQKNKRPGQFILTGSVRFTSRKSIQESLTGRIHTIEVLPLTLAEMNRQPLQDFFLWPNLTLNLIEKQITNRLEWITNKKMFAFLDHGGLPGICFLRKSAHRSAKFKSQVDTLLQRDLRFITETTVPFNRLLQLLKYLALQQGIPLVVKEASRVTHISQKTINNLLAAFEALFLIRRVGGSGDRRGDVFYIEDQGMASFLSSQHSISLEQRFAFSQLYANAHYNKMNDFTLTHFESKGGAYVPFVFQSRDQIIGFIINPSEAISQSSMKAASALLARNKNATIYFLSYGKQVIPISRSMLRVPILSIV